MPAFGMRAGRRQPHAGEPQFSWVRMLDDHPHRSRVRGPSDELSCQLAEAGERVVHADVASCGVAGQQGDHGAGDAGWRADRVAAPADLLQEGGTKPAEVTGQQARGKLHDHAHRLKGKRPQPGRRDSLTPEHVRIAERPVDCGNDTPQQPPRVAGIARRRGGEFQLCPAVLVVHAEERQADQQVQIVAAWRVTADLRSKCVE